VLPVKAVDMKNLSRHHIARHAAILFSALLMASCSAKPQGKSDAASPAEESLRRFLQTLDNDKATRYITAFHDLNDDGTPEALVYLLGRKWCGSGGCNTLVLTQDRNSWRMVANISITRPPIRVLADQSNGWHGIGVWVQGGGIQNGYEAELRFDGKSYPRNPSVPPAKRLEGQQAGEVVIASTGDGKLLYGQQATSPTGRNEAIIFTVLARNQLSRLPSN
jgi:hypothetical protein